MREFVVMNVRLRDLQKHWKAWAYINTAEGKRTAEEHAKSGKHQWGHRSYSVADLFDAGVKNDQVCWFVIERIEDVNNEWGLVSL